MGPTIIPLNIGNWGNMKNDCSTRNCNIAL